MFCSNCGTKIKEDDRFCKKCGQEQDSIVESNEKEDDDNFLESKNYNDDGMGDTENENELILNKESFLKKTFKRVGAGGLVVGSGFLWSLFAILQFLFIAFAGLSMIELAILLFSEGSIIWGLLALFIGTPIAIGIASYFFIFFLILTILASIIWSIIYIFGFDISFDSVWDGIWIFLKILVLGGMAFFGISSFVEAIKNKDVVPFFKENWFYIPIFFFLLWLFF